MDVNEFVDCGKDMVDYIAQYMRSVKDRLPVPDVEPGYLKKLIPEQAPHEGESWHDVKKDLESVIMKGNLHWRSPHFHAYLPLASSFPALLADMLSGALSTNPFTWHANPVSTELEVAMLDWLAKMLQLPQEFLFSSGGKGGGCVQTTADDAVLFAILSARSRVIQRSKGMTKGQVIDKLVAYASEEVHSSMTKAANLALVQIRCLETDERFALRGPTLAAAIQEDRSKGLIPFFLCATVGTTSTCAIDNLSELGPICEKEDLWMHVDAAYAGSACICPEYRHLINGVEHSTTFTFNPHKWLHVNPQASVMWVKDRTLLTEPFSVDPFYLRNHDTNGSNGASTMPDFRHWHIQLTRPFSSLKLWFVLRMYGVRKLQDRIRQDCEMAKQFEAQVLLDPRFEIVAEVNLGFVCFRLKGDNAPNEKLLKMINTDRRICMTPSVSKDIYFLRFCISVCTTSTSNVTFAWNVVREQTDLMLGPLEKSRQEL